MQTEPHPPSWPSTEQQLIRLAGDDLAAGAEVVPTLAAFAGDDPVALVGLRPFGPGEVIQALVEVLALLIPLGADRLGFAASGRAWSTEDPLVPVCDEGDLRQRVVVLALADAHERPCSVSTALYPFDLGPGGVQWQTPHHEEDAADGPVTTALRVLLDARDDLGEAAEDRSIAAQFGRVLLLGHDLALSPPIAQALTEASAR